MFLVVALSVVFLGSKALIFDGAVNITCLHPNTPPPTSSSDGDCFATLIAYLIKSVNARELSVSIIRQNKIHFRKKQNSDENYTENQ